jgi:phage terminase large subunit
MTPNQNIEAEAMLLHPVAFGQTILHNRYYPWQEQVLDSMYLNRRTALKAANGSGKTDKVIATAVLWWLSTFEKSMVVVTSASWDQVLHQIWPSILRHQDKLGKGWIITKDEIKCPNGSMCIARSTNEPGKFEGHHGNQDRPLLIIADESKTIPDEIFGAVNRCTYQRLLLTSSPGVEEGYFYRAFTGSSSLFQCFTATAYDCPHISKASIDETIREYGIEDPYVRSKVFAEFMKDSGSGDWYKPVKLTDYERCLLDPPHKKMGERHAYCDFAAGGDENVISIMEGNEILPLICWRDKDTTRAAADFVEKLRENGLSQEYVYGDEDGVGHAIIDTMERLGFKIQRVRNGSKPRNHDRYSNAGTEAWFEAGRMIQRKEVILPHDPILREQLTTRKGDRKDTSGKYYIQSKSEIAKSPDRGDGVVGVMYWKGSGQVYEVHTDRKLLFAEEDNEQKDFNREELISQGIWAG